MPSFILYGTSACHLCEQAEAILLALQRAGVSFDFTKVDIAADDALFERYGVHIPVLRNPVTDAQLGWPFGADQAMAFLEPARRKAP